MTPTTNRRVPTLTVTWHAGRYRCRHSDGHWIVISNAEMTKGAYVREVRRRAKEIGARVIVK